MQRRVFNITLLSLVVSLAAFLLSACGGGTPPPMLPTTTPAPTRVLPTATETPLPPPTVTPLPTVTPRGDVPVLPTGDIPPPTTAPGTGATPTTEPTGGASTPFPQDSPTPTQPPPPTATPTQVAGYPPGVSLEQRIYFADFTQGWPTMDEPTARMYILGGQYVFEIGPYDAKYRSTLAVNERDMYVQIEVIPTECPEDGGYGMLFRYVDDNNYYLLTIYCNNSFSISAKMGGSFAQQPLTYGSLPGGMDATSPDTHILAIYSKDDSFTLYLNEQEIGGFGDNRHQQGDVAMYAISQSPDVTHVAFDNLEVWTVR